MVRHKRVAMVSGLVGALVALVLPFAVSSPASAGTNNVVTVTKVVNGTPTQAGNFEIVVNCGVGNIQTLTFPATGGTQQASMPDTATNCTVQETQKRGAQAPGGSSSIQAVSPTANIVVPNGNDAGVAAQITFVAGGGQTATVGVTNTFFPAANANTVAVTKAVTGQAPAGAFFQVDVSCGGATVSLLFTAAGGTKNAAFAPTDLGACTVNESVASPAPVATTYNPVALGAFNAGGGQNKAVTVTNRYTSPDPQNVITVEKRLRGQVPPGATFTVAVACSVTAGDPVVPPIPVQTFVYPAAGGSHQFSVSKEHRDCTVTETVNSGAAVDYQATVPAPASLLNAGPANVNIRFAPNGAQTASVVVTNRYPDPTPSNVLTITKVTPDGTPPGTLFLVQVDCSGGPVGPLLFGAGQPATQEIQTPATGGGTCSVVETVSSGASRVIYGATADSPDTILIVVQPPPGLGVARVLWPVAVNPLGDEAQVTITNRFSNLTPPPANTLRIKKRIRGDAPDAPSFDIRVRCSGGGVTQEQIVTFTDQTPVDLAIPANRNNCVVHEVDDGGATSVEYFAVSATGDATDGPNSGRVEFGTTGGESGKVRVTNRFPGSCPAGGPKYC